MFSIPNLFHVNIMITNPFFVKNNSIVANSSVNSTDKVYQKII